MDKNGKRKKSRGRKREEEEEEEEDFWLNRLPPEIISSILLRLKDIIDFESLLIFSSGSAFAALFLCLANAS